MTPTFSCSSDSSGNTRKCPVYFLQPPACDWGIPGTGPQRECRGLRAREGGQGCVHQTHGLLLNVWETMFEHDPLLIS